VLGLVLDNFPGLVGGTTEAIVVALLVAAAFLAGIVVALVLRARRPAVYRDLVELADPS